MNEFTAKKMGEVLAFSIVGAETFSRAENACRTIFKNYDEALNKQRELGERLKDLAEENNVSEAVIKKANATSDKLRVMRDTYVGDEWENAAEIMEWSGFFEGSAIVHWSLVEGAGEALEIEELKTLSAEAKEFHHQLLHTVIEKIKEYAATQV